MKKYKYSIEMQFIDATNKVYNINPENFVTLIIDSDYDNYCMPMMHCRLNLDKNLSDKIILDADTGSMNLSIYKFLVDGDDELTGNKELYIRGQFTYIINKDINYNKEIDYQGQNKDREDIYRELDFGMMLKKNIDDNKKSTNTTIVDTTMVNIIHMVTNHMPMVIEPLTYNDVVPQLIIKPHDTVDKTLRMLNNVAVFYDTPYRFFLDFDVTYLISSSGFPIQKRSEKYDSVIFNVHPVDDANGNLPGMEEDHENKCYKIPLSVKDTNYVIDKSINKRFNNISAILDTSKEKSESLTSNLNRALEKASDLISGLTKKVEESVASIFNLPNDICRMRRDFSINKDNLLKDEIRFYAEVKKLQDSISAFSPGTDSNGVPKKIDKETIQLNISKQVQIVRENMGKLDKLDQTHSSVAYGIDGNFDNIVGLNSFLGGVTPINIKDNISSMQRLRTKLDICNSQNRTTIDGALKPAIEDIRKINVAINTIINIVESVSDFNSDINIETYTNNIRDINSDIAKNINGIDGQTNTLHDFCGKMEMTTMNVSPMISGIGNIDVDLKGQFANIGSVESIADGAKNMLKTLQEQMGASKISNLDISDIAKIRNDLSSVRDISTIGKLGIPKFDAKLDFGFGTKDSTQKDLIFRVENDNANMIKNIKHSIETSVNQIFINKNDLDTSVFTINKKYTIKNYDAHSDKDGSFLLSRKREIYFREGENFLCIAMLDFKKLKD